MFIRKSLITAIVFSTSTVSVAGSMGPECVPGNATVPCVNRAWELGIQALYLNPSYSINGFTQTNIAIPAAPAGNAGVIRLVTNSVANNANNHWNWGFKLEGAYHFKTGNDLNLNWYHYNHSNSQLLKRSPGVANFFQDELTAATLFSDVANSLKTNWNAVNLEMGQLLDFSEWATVRFHGGFQYANIQTTSTNTAISNNTAEEALELVNITNSNTTMKYNGFGPRVGLDLFYMVNHAFSVYGKAATALLIGPKTFNNFNAGLYTPNAETTLRVSGPFAIFGSGSNTTLVPELEAKAGGAYTFFMAKSSLTIDAGWMWAAYFNAQGASASPHGLATSGYPLQTQINFGIQGAYAGLKWLGNMI